MSTVSSGQGNWRRIHSGKFSIRPRKRFSSRLWKLRLATLLVTCGVIGLIVSAIILAGLFFYYSRELPAPDKVKRREGFSTVVSDRNDLTIYDIFADKNRLPVNLSDIPDHLRKATVAIEDKDFYRHQGFDPRGIARAVFNIITFHGIQGGSTLTQQLVKNVLLTGERTFPRKIKEFILAIQIERKYSKDEILQMYLNESPYGGTMWGIESAAQGYFGKHAKDLTLVESVILAGLPQRPTYYSPFSSNPKAYISRAEGVLRRMKEDNYITAAAEAEYKRQLPTVSFASSSGRLRALHFVEYIKKQLTEKFGEKMVEAGGLKVKTSLDLKLQEKTEQIISEEIGELKGLSVTNGAAVIVDPSSGEILAYVGSKAYESDEEGFQGKFDVASLGLRQPGSVLKPITYAVAFMKGYTPASLLMDVETNFPGGVGKPDYIPKNYDGKHRGPVQVRFALGNSINIPAVKMTALVGVKGILELAYDMGISSLEATNENIRRLGLSLTLGGGEVRLVELTSAFGVFATSGIRNELYSILKVTDSNGNILYEHKPIAGKRVLPREVSFLISHILLDNQARKEVFGERSYLVVPGKTVAVKTGTTDDKRDNWTVGYTPSVVVGVWVGNNDNSPMNPKIASGVTGATPIWNRIMRELLKNKDDEQFEKPDDVISLEIDAFGGGLPHEGRPKRSEYFIKGTEPTKEADIYRKLKISKSDSNKLANAVEVASGEFEEKEFVVFIESDPTSEGAEKNRWQEGIDTWLAGLDDPLYKFPKETSTKDENKVVVNIRQPEDKKQFDSNEVEVEAEAKALRDIRKMEIYVDGNQKTSVSSNTIKEKFTLDTGVHTIRVKAYDDSDHSGESEVTIGVKVSAEATPTPS